VAGDSDRRAHGLNSMAVEIDLFCPETERLYRCMSRLCVDTLNWRVLHDRLA
jgi:hypothetical protein